MEIKNFRISPKLKKILATISAGVITFTSTGCGVNDKYDDDAVANNNIVFIEEQTVPTTSISTVGTTTTTTLKPINKDLHRRKYVNSTDDTDYVEDSYENDIASSNTTFTSTKNSNDDVTINDNTTKSISSKDNSNTTKNTGSKITTEPNSYSSQSISKTTKFIANSTDKPTKTTAQPTTTVTTTTTEAVTEAPVTEPVQQNYNINDICYDADAFRHYAMELTNFMKTAPDGTYYNAFCINGRYTSLIDEGLGLLALLNYGYINDDVIANVFSKYDYYNFVDFQDFLYSLSVNNNESIIDFENYCIDRSKGQYINFIQDSALNGTFSDFVNSEIGCQNMPQEYLQDLTIGCMYNAFGRGSVMCTTEDDVNFVYTDSIDMFNEYIYSIALGKSYTY